MLARSKAPARTYEFTPWGSVSRQCATMFRPERIAEVSAAVASLKDFSIVGMGSSFGQTAYGSENLITTRRLDRFITFDREKGLLICESGTTMRKIIQVVAERGYSLPVMPFSLDGSIGGAVAQALYSSNHVRDGGIGRHIVWLRLIRPDGECIECSENMNPELFRATIGGFGATGIIIEVAIQLSPLSQPWMIAETCKIQNLGEMLKIFGEAMSESSSMVAVIDHFGHDAEFGQGFFIKARYARKDAEEVLNFPGFDKMEPTSFSRFISTPLLMNRMTLAFTRKLQSMSIPEEPRQELLPMHSVLCLHDLPSSMAIASGGRKSVYYEFIIPDSEELEDQMCHVLELFQKWGVYSLDTTVRYMGRTDGGLTFPIPGFCVAMIFDDNDKAKSAIQQANDYLAEVGGRVAVASDKYLEREHFEAMYGDYIIEFKQASGIESSPITSLMLERLLK